MNEHQLGKQQTKFVRVSERLAVELRVFPFLEASRSGHASWFEDRHLQEIVQLLRDHIFARVATEGKNDSVASKSGILTGVNIRLGYTFKKKPVRHICLVLRHQDNAALNRASEETKALSGDGAYRHYNVYQEKVVVFVCPLKGASHSSMSQLMSAVGNSSQTASISNYFQRQTTVSQQSASSSSESTAGLSLATSECKESKGKQPKTVSSTSVRKRKIKSILARKKPKPPGTDERAAQKVKTARKEDTGSNKENHWRTEESDQSSEPHAGISLEIPARTRHLPEDTSSSCDTSRIRDSDTAGETHQKTASECLVEDQIWVSAEVKLHGTDSEGIVEEASVSHFFCHLDEKVPSSPAAKLSTECPGIQVGDVESVFVGGSDAAEEGDGERVSLSGIGKITCAETGFPEGFHKEKKGSDQGTVDSKEPQAKRSRVGPSLSLGRRRARAAKDGLVVDKNKIGPSKERDHLYESLHREIHSYASTACRHDLSSTSTAAMRVDDSSLSGGDCPIDDGLPLLTLKRRPIKIQTKSGNINSGISNLGISGQKSEAFPLTASSSYDFKENLPELPGLKSSGAASNDVLISDVGAVWEDEELPVLTFKPRRYGQGRRVTELLRRSALREFQDDKGTEKRSIVFKAADSACGADADIVTVGTDEEEAQEPLQPSTATKAQTSGKLKADASVSDVLEELRKTYSGVREVSLLSVTQVEVIVTTLKKHLLRIFQGQVESRRHEEYKKGGPACRLLNDEMLNTALTEEQQDAVMDSLISIFCRKHYEYIPYLLKVLLPETIICIYMVVHGLPYQQTEKGLRQEYLVYCDPPSGLI